MLFDESSYTEQNVSYDEFASSLVTIYAYLKQENRLNHQFCRYEIREDILNQKGWAGKHIIIPMEECIDCERIYFHNPDDCGLDEGEGLVGDKGSEWICTKCLCIREEANIMPFDCDRAKLRYEKKVELINSGIKLENQDKCCICLDELIICEVDDSDGRIDKNKTLVCNHTTCGKCYFDLKKSTGENICCPLCRTNIG